MQKESNIAFIVMPFYTIDAPDVITGTLKSLLKERGIRTDVKYYNITFYNILNYHDLYNSIISSPIDLCYYDWFISSELLNITSSVSQFNSYFDYSLNNGLDYNIYSNHALIKSSFLKLISDIIDSELLINYDALFFHAKYMNLFTSLFLAKMLKQDGYNNKIIFFGDLVSGKERATELLRTFPFIDYIFYLTNYSVLVEFTLDVLSDCISPYYKDCVNRGGILHANDFYYIEVSGHSLNDLPIPNYDDYFNLEDVTDYEKVLVIETSAGCYWGKCNFCTAKGDTNRYDTKCANRIYNEMINLSNKYKILNFELADVCPHPNTLVSLATKIINDDLDFTIFCESRIDLDKESLKLLYDAGFKTLQVGIESLNSRLLLNLNKGQSAIENISFLKSAKEAGIKVNWNLLYAIPQEDEQDYLDIEKKVPQLIHLDPPNNITKVRFERNSIYNRSLRNIYFSPIYNFIYCEFNDDKITNLAEYFMYDNNHDAYYEKLNDCIHDWKEKREESKLIYQIGKDFILIIDFRNIYMSYQYVLTDWAIDLYLLCDSIQKLPHIMNVLRSKYYIEERNIINTLEFLLHKDLMIKEDNKYLSLALHE